MANTHGHKQEHSRRSSGALTRVIMNRTVLAVLYLIALGALVAWEYRERFAERSEQCTEADQSERSQLFAGPYRALLEWASAESAHHVTVMSITADVEDAQSSNCVGRAYLADVIAALGPMHPAELVVDKFYSPASCALEPQGTKALEAAMQAATFPIVVGESTGMAPENPEHVCLQQKPQLDFGSANVRHGLTRLNAQREKLPITWEALPQNATPEAPPLRLDGLAWAAVKGYDPQYAAGRRLQALVKSDDHPWINLNIQLPHTTTTELLCAAGSAEVKKRWSVACGPGTRVPSLLGKIIVVGSERQEDRRAVLDTKVWGFDLHAMYIEDLLSGMYLSTLPFWAAFLLFALFVFVVEGVPTLLQLVKPQWKHKRFLCHAYKRRRYYWMTFWTLTLIVLSTVVCLALRFLPPLVVFGDICLVAITKLLIFAAESTEHPLLHNPRKVEPTP